MTDDLRYVQRFKEAWEKSSPPQLADFLPEAGSVAQPTSRAILVELVIVDMERRWRLDNTDSNLRSTPADGLSFRPIVEDYINLFPELTSIEGLDDLVAHEYRIRLLVGDKPNLDTYEIRFPKQIDSLRAKRRQYLAEMRLFHGCRNTYLDVDGDGSALPLTDGILLIRYLAGFRGNSLVSGAVSQTGTRTSADQIEAWLGQFSNQGSGPVASRAPVAGDFSSAPTPLPDKDESVLQSGSWDRSAIFVNDEANESFLTQPSNSWRNVVEVEDALDKTETQLPDSDELDLVFADAIELNL